MGALIQTSLVIFAGAAAVGFLLKKFFVKPKKKDNACTAECKCH